MLMEDLETIHKVIGYISSDVEQLQVASVFCITNLIRAGSGAGSTGVGGAEHVELQLKLREMGAEKQLQTLLTTSNSNLCDR